MKRIFSKTGFTLIELVIASLLVIVVVAGIYAVNNVLSNNNQDYGQRYLVRSETQASLNHILNNASLATGSANGNDEAIIVGVPGVGGVTDNNSFCIHQQGGNNLVNSAQDIWLCYSWVNYQISWCAETYGPNRSPAITNDPRGASNCTFAATAPSTLVAGTSVTFLGTAYSGPTASFTASGGQSLFSVTIQNYLNNSGSTSDPAHNPGTTLSGSVIPLQASSQ